jgi:hypothetical protein
MRTLRNAVVGIALLSLCVAAATQKSPHINDISNCPITGELGKPMGTLCRIQGTARAIASPGHKDDGPNAVWMDIDTVDGVAINPPVRLETAEDVRVLAKPLKAGETFNLIAYESGYFCGAASDPSKLAPASDVMVESVRITSGQNNFGRGYQIREWLNIVDPKQKQ